LSPKLALLRTEATSSSYSSAGTQGRGGNRGRAAWKRKSRRRRLIHGRGHRRTWRRASGNWSTRIEAVSEVVVPQVRRFGGYGRGRENAVQSRRLGRACRGGDGVDCAQVKRAVVMVEDEIKVRMHGPVGRSRRMCVGESRSKGTTDWRSARALAVQVVVVQASCPPRNQRARGWLSGAGSRRSSRHSRCAGLGEEFYGFGTHIGSKAVEFGGISTRRNSESRKKFSKVE
jgi:hypothetical protein